MIFRFVAFIVFFILASNLNAQDSLSTNIQQKFINDFSNQVVKKTDWLKKEIDKKSEKALRRMQKLEQKLQQKLAKIDSLAEKKFFVTAEEKYQQLLGQLQQKSQGSIGRISGEYLPYLDSLQGGLSFLQTSNLGNSVSEVLPGSVKQALDGINELQNKLQQSQEIDQFLQQRESQLKNLISQYHLPRNIGANLKEINKEVYYYTAQLREYKEMFRDPDKLERKALSILNKVPAFQSFMKQHSQLASLFNFSGAYTPGIASTGMQARDQVLNFVQNQFGTNGPNAQSVLQGNIQSVAGQLDQVRNKLSSSARDGDLEMPNFKPNNQRTKTFFKRLEYGTNLQTVRSSSYFPSTSDIGLSIGYKLNDKNIIGFGASYNVGWGSSFRHIEVTNQGAGLRSFIDLNIKKSFFLSGGFEYNYQQPFSSISIVNELSNWSQSGLVGISKIVAMKTKIFKKTKIQLLWDFLSYRQRPQTQALKFRIGYNF